MIQLKQSEFRVPGLERHTEKLFPFYLNYDKPCGELESRRESYQDYQSGQVKFSRYVSGNTERY